MDEAMTLDQINARIAEIQQRKAERQAFQRMYRPSKATATWDYVAEGNRSGLDKISSDEAAYHNMLRQQEQQNRMLKEQQAQQNRMLKAQQDFTALQNELNRNNALYISNKNKEDQVAYMKNELANKYQLALTDYELAAQQVDMQKPETLARLKRAAQLVNHYGSQLNFDAVSSEATVDSEPIKINKAVSKVKALKRIKPKKWTNEQKQEYVDAMALIPDEDERKAELIVDLENMPKTTEEKEKARYDELKKKKMDGANLFGSELVDWERLSKKYGE